MRFIAACPNGHLQDFPWWEWLFKTAWPEKKGWLRMTTSGSASLGGVRVQCVVGEDLKTEASRTLAGAFNYEPGSPTALSKHEIFCKGDNPALHIPSPTVDSPGCGEHLYPLLRGGSNVYFPHVVSSIYLPPADFASKDAVLEILEDRTVWTFVTLYAQASGGTLSEEMAKSILVNHYPDRNLLHKDLAEAANRKLNGETGQSHQVETDSEEQRFRREEYDLFCKDVREGYPKTNLLVKNQNTTDYEDIISSNFDRIALLHKLRETRAFTGFSRIFPDNDLSPSQRRALISRNPKEWLPAVIVRGEGIFLLVSEARIQQWLVGNEPKLSRRVYSMQNTLDQLHERRHQSPREVTPRFVLLHTLAHLLVNRLVFQCGYGSASLRERLYCSDDAAHPMAGILLYTAAGDAEGTMGGLVRMGKPGRLEAVLRSALEDARWCSTDPVCIESSGQGPDNCNLAACYCCALLPETSCEEQNRLLDRGMVVGILSNPEMGFFNT